MKFTSFSISPPVASSRLLAVEVLHGAFGPFHDNDTLDNDVLWHGGDEVTGYVAYAGRSASADVTSTEDENQIEGDILRNHVRIKRVEDQKAKHQFGRS